MKALDGDDGLLRGSRGNMASRDIVQVKGAQERERERGEGKRRECMYRTTTAIYKFDY
jgi:hypothetical protein